MADTKAEIRPKALMTEEELKAWEALPPAVQLARLRAAIDDGVMSGISDLSMDDILQAVLARHPNLGI